MPNMQFQRRELTAIESKYCLSFLATWYAIPLRVIGSRPLFQHLVEIFHHSQCVTTQLGQASRAYLGRTVEWISRELETGLAYIKQKSPRQTYRQSARDDVVCIL